MTNLFQHLIQQISDRPKQHTKDGGSVPSYVHTPNWVMRTYTVSQHQ